MNFSSPVAVARHPLWRLYPPKISIWRRNRNRQIVVHKRRHYPRLSADVAHCPPSCMMGKILGCTMPGTHPHRRDAGPCRVLAAAQCCGRNWCNPRTADGRFCSRWTRAPATLSASTYPTTNPLPPMDSLFINTPGQSARPLQRGVVGRRRGSTRFKRLLTHAQQSGGATRTIPRIFSCVARFRQLTSVRTTCGFKDHRPANVQRGNGSSNGPDLFPRR